MQTIRKGIGVAEAQKDQNKEEDHHLQPNINTLNPQGQDRETLIKLQFVLFHEKNNTLLL